MQRRRPRQHIRRLESGKKTMINEGIKKENLQKQIIQTTVNEIKQQIKNAETQLKILKKPITNDEIFDVLEETYDEEIIIDDINKKGMTKEDIEYLQEEDWGDLWDMLSRSKQNSAIYDAKLNIIDQRKAEIVEIELQLKKDKEKLYILTGK